jgi:hypothetical protein
VRHLFSPSPPPPPPQAEDIPARKKPRLDEPLPSTSDEVARKIASPDVSVGLPPPAADNDDVNTIPVTDTQLNAVTTGATGRWTTDEDAKLTGAVAKTPKKRYGYTTKYKIDWFAIAALVPGRTRIQCYGRWHDVLTHSNDGVTGRAGKWTEDEDNQLKDAVKMHGGKKWGAIATLVPGRTRSQCSSRWYDALDPNIYRATRSKGKWAADEDSKSKEAVQTHGGKNWIAIATLVPGRTKNQCMNRWHDVLDPSIDRGSGRTGKWSEDEDLKLKDAVERHGGKDWVALSALVPGRTKVQCMNRWHDVLDPSVDRGSGRRGKLSEDENIKLKDAVKRHGGNESTVYKQMEE